MTGDNVDERWAAHGREHALIALALDNALISSTKALDAALTDHHREHIVHESAHAREHIATDQALQKAENATEKRFEGVNEFREQLRTQASTLASRDQVEALVKEMDRRFVELSRSTQEKYEANRNSIVAIEKGDVKQEGKGIGQGTVIAAIVTAIGVVGGLLGILIIIANFATNK